MIKNLTKTMRYVSVMLLLGTPVAQLLTLTPANADPTDGTVKGTVTYDVLIIDTKKTLQWTGSSRDEREIPRPATDLQFTTPDPRVCELSATWCDLA